MSDLTQEKEIEAKTGHPPAVKVGGVRVAQRTRKDSEESKAKEKTEKPEEQSSSAFGLFKPPVVVTGPPAKVDQQIKEFPKEETKHAHDKPVPTHQPAAHFNKPTVIQQPRK